MHIKSKLLLPPDETLVQEEEEQDPRAELVKRLLEYKKFKEAAAELAQKESHQKHFYARVGSGINIDELEDPKDGCFEASLFDLITAFTKVLRDIPKEVFHRIVRDEFTVSEKIHDVLHMLLDNKKVMFTDLFKAAKNKTEIITIFLAILELIKIREVSIIQHAPFGEIEIVKSMENIKPSVGENG
jgi:segregation and condensation protein A